jgi:hypothetical protein
MRTLTTALVTAFALLFSQQIAAASGDQEERGNSQVAVRGTVACFPDGSGNSVGLRIGAGLGVGLEVITAPDGFLAIAIDRSEECSDLVSGLAGQVPDRTCEIGGPTERGIENFSYICTGRADAVISAIGEMAKAVSRLGQP